MVNLTRIYTRTGDDGTTGLGDFGRTSKDDPRLVAYADTDEANAALGVAMLHAGERTDIAEVVRRIQNELFDVGADLSLPLRASYEYEPLRVVFRDAGFASDSVKINVEQIFAQKSPNTDVKVI